MLSNSRYSISFSKRISHLLNYSNSGVMVSLIKSTTVLVEKLTFHWYFTRLSFRLYNSFHPFKLKMKDRYNYEDQTFFLFYSAPTWTIIFTIQRTLILPDHWNLMNFWYQLNFQSHSQTKNLEDQSPIFVVIFNL